MRFKFRGALLAGLMTFATGFVSLAPTPALAQEYVSFESFHDQLAGYGAWLYSDRWGLVWQPGDVPDDFLPYFTDGRWIYTSDYGWMWSSDYDWGDIPFHYGRWVNDPGDGWLWIPGYTWAPAWVVWRTNQDYVGWMPMPPDQGFINGTGISLAAGTISFGWNNDPYYGYRHWYGGDYDERRFASNWVFVGFGHIADRDYGRYAVRDPARAITIVNQTRTVESYTVVNNYVVNKGIDVHRVEQAAHHPIQALPARQINRHPNLIASITAGQHAREQAGAIAPLGRGTANSAPPPAPQTVLRLSASPPKRHGGQPSTHLFTKTDVSNPAVLTTHFRGKAADGAPPYKAPTATFKPADAPPPPASNDTGRTNLRHGGERHDIPRSPPADVSGGAPNPASRAMTPRDEVNGPVASPERTPMHRLPPPYQSPPPTIENTGRGAGRQPSQDRMMQHEGERSGPPGGQPADGRLKNLQPAPPIQAGSHPKPERPDGEARGEAGRGKQKKDKGDDNPPPPPR